MKKVLHITTGLDNGGAEKVLLDLVSYRYGERNVEHVIVSLQGTGYHGPTLDTLSVKVYALGLSKYNFILKLFDLLRIIRVESPDVVQGWMYHGNLISLLAKLCGVKTILWGIHNSVLDATVSSYVLRLINKVCACLSFIPNKIIYVGKVPLRLHLNYGYNAKNGVVINNGYNSDSYYAHNSNLREELNLSPTVQVLGCIGRFNPMKDHENLFRALSLLGARVSDFIILLAGSGINSENCDLMRLINAAGVNDKVILLGQRSDMSEIYNSLDYLVLSSCTEAFPNVVAEAMLCEVPCVVTEAGDASEIVGDTGFISPIKSPKVLADKIEQALALDPNKAKLLGLKARERIINNFSLLKMVQSYHKLYL